MTFYHSVLSAVMYSVWIQATSAVCMDTEETLSLVAKQWALLQYHTGRLVLLARNGFHKRRSGEEKFSQCKPGFCAQNL